MPSIKVPLKEKAGNPARGKFSPAAKRKTAVPAAVVETIPSSPSAAHRSEIVEKTGGSKGLVESRASLLGVLELHLDQMGMSQILGSLSASADRIIANLDRALALINEIA